LISVLQLGTIDYAAGLRLQQQLVALRKEQKIGDVLLLLEHLPVITLGRNAKAANVIASPDLLRQRGVELFECDRGGDVTFHGPGQIVGYPIFDLRGFQTAATSEAQLVPAALARPVESSSTARKHLGAVDFVRRLEEVLIRTCTDFAIPTRRVPGLTGVWTDPATTNAHVGTAACNTTDHVGTGAPARPVERSSTAAAKSATNSQDHHACGGHDFSRAESSYAREGHDFSRAESSYVREGHDFSRAESDQESAAALAAEGRFPIQTAEAKLAAIGIHISRFVTSHGFALNVNTDLSYFDLIIPCGITSKPVTSMRQQLGRQLDLNAVAESISRNFGVVFQSQVLWVETLDALLGRTVGVPMKPPTELRRLHKEDDTTWA
jgi:lipoate-protein ligase B